MKKMLFLAALMLATVQAMAGNVDMATAQAKATGFLRQSASNARFMTSAPTIKWTHEVKNSSNAAQAAYYIVNTDRGYVIVAGDDRAREILAYGDQPLTDLNDLPDNMQFFLNLYKAEMEYLQAHPGIMVNKGFKSSGVSVEPLLKTAWAQDKPYNYQCPKVGKTYCMVGCTATSLAQVMRYWEYPKIAPALPGYQCPDSKINVPDLPGGYTFDWDNMLDTYYGVDLDRLPQVNADAVAWLMRYVGQAETIDYNTDRSGTENFQILNAIRTFGYDEGVHIVKKYDSPDYTGDLDHDGHEFYNDEEWGELIQAELRAGRPLVYCAYDMSSDSTSLGGHAFNVDGYDATNDLYHVNFGMKPSLNAYYALNAFSTDGWLTVYDFWPIFFAGVQPPGLTTDPRILTSTEAINMEAYVGETATATFTVSGDNLTGNITATVSDENGVFTADATTITLDELGKTITVTYAPQAIGTHNATITLSSEGADNKVVTLKGTATNAPLVVYDPVMLPAIEQYISLTSFRADWTDQTAAANVASYTLEVQEKPAAPVGLLAEVDWSELPKMNGNQASNALSYLPEGWGFSGYDFYLDGGCVEIGTEDYILTRAFDLSGCDKVTVVFRGKNYYDWKNSPVKISTSVDSKEFELATDFADYTVVLNVGDVERIKFEATDGMIHIQGIQIYAGEVTAPQFKAVAEQGDASYRLITGITDKFYTVTGLTAEGTYNYKVKALYTDGTESAWSNIEAVTLFDNGAAHMRGDVDHNGRLSIDDVTTLIDYLLGAGDVCTTCADVDGNGKISIDDVTTLIDMLLSGN
ncbi:MAG: C10 family peptidase [Muribaculaceae bacterium]|nr:C10 family peptidase [Muribaculaceae bacterium]